MRNILAVLALATAAPALPAQGLGDLSTIVGPQHVNYKIGSGADTKTVTQLSIPLAFILPVTDRFTVDVSSSWADSRVTAKGIVSSKISGLTDTQVRANLSFFDNTAVFTIGLNVPTGMYKVPDAQQEAAGQIGSDFLLYPVSSMGSGAAVTSGIALARSWGEWNVGFAGSFRYSSPFDAYEVQNTVLRFEPGSETRARLGIDRALGDGRLSLAGTFSTYTDDKADSTTFATGARILGQATVSYPTSAGEWTVSGWNLFRAKGQQIGAVAPSENIANVNLAVGFNLGGLFVQPSAEARAWMRDFERAGAAGTGGLRLRFEWLGISVNPAVTYTIGRIYSDGASATAIDARGLRGSLLIRVR